MPGIIKNIVKNILPVAATVFLLLVLLFSVGLKNTTAPVSEEIIEETTESDTSKVEEPEPDLALSEEEIITDEDEEEPLENLMVPFDVENTYSYCKNPKCLIDENKENIVYSFDFTNGIPRSDDDNVYLFEFSTYEDDETEGKKAIQIASKAKEVSIEVPYEERYLFSRFAPAVKYEGEYILLENAKYVMNPEALAYNTCDYFSPDSKKGILLDANTIDKPELYDLNVKRAVYNIPLSFIIGETENESVPTIEYEYNGETYEFDGFMCGGFDSLISYLTQQGIHTTIIILNDWNKEHPEIIHPKARKRTGRSQYYAFNTEEEEGVRLMEATAMFLAERYSGGSEYGLVNDWIIANEVNQQKIWNYMDTKDIDYYTESFERSFRTFYNAIKSNYSNAKVYYSIDHDFNDNYGNNGRFFNGKEFLYKFNEYADKGGNYDWSLSIHPYPNPLSKVKFWKGSFDKTENAGVLTPMNLSSVTDIMKKTEFLNNKGEVRDIGITELGFSSGAGEKLQAAAFAYCYYIVENNEYICSFLMNRQTDDAGALKSGLRLGIYNYDYSPKYIKKVFTNVDGENRDELINEMLEVIGAGSLEEALSWAE
ncbi:MAG: DUF5722 domain-containing protein [Lachnospiraceae bacterium]|nr:DUF5722 domain-containing protein [Lachnospiraceae bacterium]